MRNKQTCRLGEPRSRREPIRPSLPFGMLVEYGCCCRCLTIDRNFNQSACGHCKARGQQHQQMQQANAPGPDLYASTESIHADLRYAIPLTSREKKNSMSGGGAFGNDDRGPHTFYLNPCILSVLREHPTPPTPPGYVPFHHILPTPACRTSGMSRAMSTILIVCLHTFVVFPLA